MSSEIMVSIICNAYNHEKFIAATIEGFVTQKTNFAFEVLIHDDASTDNTASIIKEYAEKYPDIVKPIYQTENQYSQKVKISRTYQYPRAQGKYWALCEGDDYWCDENKLQRQVDALEAHPELDICAHTAYLEHNGVITGKLEQSNTERIFTVEEVIMGGGGFVATNSLMIRRDVWTQTPPYTQILSLDYVHQIQGSMRGGMLYLPECMSVYREMAAGSWSVRSFKDTEYRIRHWNTVEKILLTLDQDTEYKYTKTITKRIAMSKISLLISLDRYKEIISKENRKYYNQMSRGEKIRLQIYGRLPWLTAFLKKIKHRKYEK